MGFWDYVQAALEGRDLKEEGRSEGYQTAQAAYKRDLELQEKNARNYEDTKHAIKLARARIILVFTALAGCLALAAYFNLVQFGPLYRGLALGIVTLFILAMWFHSMATFEVRESWRKHRSDAKLHTKSSMFSPLSVSFFALLDLLLPILGWNYEAILKDPFSAILISIKQLFFG